MGEGAGDPVEAVKRLSESHREVKLGPGVVGKTGRVTLALCAVWAVVAWKMNGGWGDLALLACGAAASGFCIWWINKTHRFAEANPGVALLEGAHLLQYQRFEAQAKGLLPYTGSNEVVHTTGNQLEDRR